MSSAIFSVQFLGQVYSWVKSMPVDKRTFLGRLKRGESFAFVLVSIAPNMFMCHALDDCWQRSCNALLWSVLMEWNFCSTGNILIMFLNNMLCSTLHSLLHKCHFFHYIYQEGVREVIMLNPSSPRDLVLCLQNHKGFVKLALATGSPIVPVFGFNFDGSYGYWILRGPFMERLSWSLGYLPLSFW